MSIKMNSMNMMDYNGGAWDTVLCTQVEWSPIGYVFILDRT